MKYAGAALIIISSLSVGLLLSSASGEALRVSEEIYRVMKYIRDEICENMTPTDIILSRLPVFQIGKTGGIYSAYEETLKKLNGAERGIFRDFCSVVGKGDAAVQRGAFDSLISQYETYLEERRKKSKNAPKLYIALSLFTGISAIIIFL